MNIKILDSWLRVYLKTKATPQKLTEVMSLTSVSIEKIEPYNNDFIFDIEVTTNRPDLMSVIGLAKEASAVLPQFGIDATFIPPTLKKPSEKKVAELPIIIKSDKALTKRICAAILEVTVKPSPNFIQERLETSDIRSLNNLIDITNYVMRTVGHPTHVFDYDKLKTQTLVIREARKNEKITTLDGKTYTLLGGDIVADDGLGNIVDLLGVMGLENSVVDENTKRILFFIDNIDPHKIRKTSMSLGIRSEAAQLNEKEVDEELAMDALLYGISLYQELADGNLASKLIDITHYQPKVVTITVTKKKIQTVLGIDLSLEKAATILTHLSFQTKIKGDSLEVQVPSIRSHDVTIPEDVIEEIARVYGYHNLPSVLPQVLSEQTVTNETDIFYWEERAKNALKYWGFSESYTYPMVSEQLYEGPIDNAVTLQNPLGDEFTYMRRTLVPSLLKVIQDNKQVPQIQLFEIANVYEKEDGKLPVQRQVLAGILKKDKINFFTVKGYLEQLSQDFGINSLSFKAVGGGMETDILIGKEKLGEIEILDDNLINFELDFELMTKHATLKRKYTPLSKFPTIMEDISVIIDEGVTTGELIAAIKAHSSLLSEVTLLDKYKSSRTFHLVYQDQTKNLSTRDIATIREKIIKTLKSNYKAVVK